MNDNNDTAVYRRMAVVWSTCLTLVFGIEVFVLLMILTGRGLLAGCVAAGLTTALLCLTCLVWGSVGEEQEQLKRRGRARHESLHSRLGRTGTLRGLRTGPSSSSSACPWAEELEARDRKFRYRKGEDFGGRFRI